MRRRTRKAVVPLAGQNVELVAPGLKQIKRKHGVDLYWAKDDAALFADYRPATVHIHVDLSNPDAGESIERICQREQAAMLLWLDERGDDRERLRPKFNGTIGSLCLIYESDPESGFSDLQQNTQSSYRDWLKIVRETIGARRIDALEAKYFRTCYRNWKAPAEPGGETRMRRAYGCIQIVKILLGYGMQGGLFYAHCERLLNALSRMRFAKNPPRDAFMTFEHAAAIVEQALLNNDPSTALVQALQFECLLRQIDIVGKWRVESTDYVLKPGEIRGTKKRVWSGMTAGLILNETGVLRIRTSKTAQYVEHALEKCELVVRCLEHIQSIDPNLPLAHRADGSPWPSHMKFGKHWRVYADAAGVPKSVWNMDNRAGGFTEASAAGASHDDLAGTGAHATKKTTQTIYMRGAAEISARVQDARQKSRRSRQAKSGTN